MSSFTSHRVLNCYYSLPVSDCLLLLSGQQSSREAQDTAAVRAHRRRHKPDLPRRQHTGKGVMVAPGCSRPNSSRFATARRYVRTRIRASQMLRRWKEILFFLLYLWLLYLGEDGRLLQFFLPCSGVTGKRHTFWGLAPNFKFNDPRNQSRRWVSIKVNSRPLLRVSKYDVGEKLRSCNTENYKNTSQSHVFGL